MLAVGKDLDFHSVKLRMTAGWTLDFPNVKLRMTAGWALDVPLCISWLDDKKPLRFIYSKHFRQT
jgi:hypothetical protein